MVCKQTIYQSEHLVYKSGQNTYNLNLNDDFSATKAEL